MFILLVGIVGGGAVSIFYYARFSRWIDALLVTDSPVSRVIWARPLELAVGDQVSPDRVALALRRAGYSEGTGGSGGWWQRSPERITFGRGGSTSEIRFSGSRVHSLKRRGEPVSSMRLDSPFLSSFASGRERRKRLLYEDFPAELVEAVLSAEDERFFFHVGIDPVAMVRSLLVNLRYGEVRQGASTLTQQFVKNYFLYSDRLISRKLQELLLAFLLERRLSKQQIFELYANDVYLGQTASFAIHGFGQGARVFFGKECSDLSLAEAATLAAMIPAPNRFSPDGNKELLLKRRNSILDRMGERGVIGRDQLEAARSTELRFLEPDESEWSGAPYFVDFVTRRLTQLADVDLAVRSDVEVFSTLDLDLQSAASRAVQQGLARIGEIVDKRDSPPQVQVALIAVDPRRGHILALIGGSRYSRGQYDRATRAIRQPGSTFKPFVLAAALEAARADLTLSTEILDAPYEIRYGGHEYAPHNYGNEYFGMVTVRTALARSLNVATLKVAERAGLETVKKLSERMGFDHRLKPSPSLALGSYEVSLLELVQAYQALANHGLLIPLTAWTGLSVNGEWIRQETSGRRVISSETAFLVTSALQSVLEEGTATGVRRRGFLLPAAGKTGTTNDAWFVGYTPELLCGVWVGTDRSPHLNLSGASAALPIWTDFMKRAASLGRLSGQAFKRPAGIQAVEIDEKSGLKASPSCPNVRTEFFVSGTEPREQCRMHMARSGR